MRTKARMNPADMYRFAQAVEVLRAGEVLARDNQPSEAALAEIDDLFLSNDEIPPRLHSAEELFRTLAEAYRNRIVQR